MSMIKFNLGKQVFLRFCRENGYMPNLTNKDYYLRLDISDLQETSIVNIYHKGAIVIQGKNNSLKKKLLDLKREFEENPGNFEGISIQSYRIHSKDIQNLILKKVKTIVETEINEFPDSLVRFRAKIKNKGRYIVLTQYNEGSLVIKGKSNEMYHQLCEMIEKTAKASVDEIASRFINDEEAFYEWTQQPSPGLLEEAEKDVKQKIGAVFDYLNDYDQKSYVAAQCLCKYNLRLPEYTAILAPAAKGFEGFAKKILVDLRIVKKDFFRYPPYNFGVIRDKEQTEREHLYTKDKKRKHRVDRYIHQIINILSNYRNPFFHSEDGTPSQIDTLDDAVAKVITIYNSTKDIFDFFNSIWPLC